MSDNKYFAAKEAKDCASILLDKATSFYNKAEANSYLEKIRKMWEAYYGRYNSSYFGDNHEVTFTGEQGELVSVPINHFRNIAQHIYVMITANRPTMEARAINTDYKSYAQTQLANGILDYYMREKRLEDVLKKATEMAVVLGSGFVKLAWNATGGEVFDYDEDTESYNYEGEIEFSNLSPLDVVVDGTKESWDHEWVLVRNWVNKYNLIAKYPELEEKILGIQTKSESPYLRYYGFSNDKTDDIAIYEFFHKPTEAVPEGRYILFASTDVILLDTKLPYRTVPVFRISAGDIMGTPYGYSPMFDVYPVQECINSLISTVMTNQTAFGVQNVFVRTGSNLTTTNLDGAMNIIEGSEEPKPLNLTQTPAEIFKSIDLMIQTAETLSGVNSVARGNPEASLKSGNALALVQSMSLQFMSGLQQSYVKLIEDVGTALISILKDYATAPKLIALVGKNNKPLLKEFTGESISNINRVIVDVGNPLARTTAGRVQMAEQMLQMQIIKNPQQYFQVINTGRLDSVYEGDMAELMLIKSENEKLLEGNSVQATIYDQHRLHILEHRTVLADPDLRRDDVLVNNVLNHIDEHLDILRTVDPALLQLLGEQPLQPPAPPPGAPMEAPAPSNVEGSPIPEEMAANAGQVVAGNQTSGPGVENINLPQPAKPPGEFKNLPTNPQDMIPQ